MPHPRQLKKYNKLISSVLCCYIIDQGGTALLLLLGMYFTVTDAGGRSTECPYVPPPSGALLLLIFTARG